MLNNELLNELKIMIEVKLKKKQHDFRILYRFHIKYHRSTQNKIYKMC
jgi:hypothetical protein